MTHRSEDSTKLSIQEATVSNADALTQQTQGFNDVCILRLPACSPDEYNQRLKGVGPLVATVAANLGPEATLITLGEVIDLVTIQAVMPSFIRYQSWIAIKRTPQSSNGPAPLPRHHFGAVVHTCYD